MTSPETTTGRPAESGHWYDHQGRPVYEIRGANGQMRPCTLRDARKLSLLPGYSSIAAMEHKPMLEAWKINQALLAAITLPRNDGEPDDEFMERARADAKAQAKHAAEKGTAIHAAIQGYYETGEVTMEFTPYVKAVRNYLLEKFGAIPWNAERSFAHPLGFGGKADLQSVNIVVDVKTKAFGEDKTVKELAWPEHVMQLAAYSHGFGFTTPTCLNLFVSTEIPGLIRVREWEAAELTSAWAAFMCLLSLWQIRKGYFCEFTSKEQAA